MRQADDDGGPALEKETIGWDAGKRAKNRSGPAKSRETPRKMSHPLN
jgi:hypothetical protein